ncbi:MAG: hypothetical protein PHW04_15715 [Candidatus Wallbacteria bacterium]|nr:hypothetical protein [Candidatus Wallbacteria bacterium]
MDSVTIGIRIPRELKLMFDQYCDSHGMKKNFLLARIIEEKISELIEDEEDLALAEKRLKDETIGASEVKKFIKRRLRK